MKEKRSSNSDDFPEDFTENLFDEIQKYVDADEPEKERPITAKDKAKNQALIEEAEKTFTVNFKIVIAMVARLEARIRSFSDLELLTQDAKLQYLKELLDLLDPSLVAVFEYYQKCDSLDLEHRLTLIDDVRKTVDEAVRIINGNSDIS